MKNLVTVFAILLCLLTLSSPAWAQTALAKWTFEGVTTTNTGSDAVVSVGSAAADSGSLTAGSSFSAHHASAATVWSNPVGNGSAKSLSSNNWGAGDYIQFLFSTSGYNNVSITWDQTSSNTGPRDFKVQYSTDGASFVDATGTNSTFAVIANAAPNAWSSSVFVSAARYSLDLGSVSALNNKSTVFIRLVDTSATAAAGGTVATAGTDRIDNFTVTGTSAGGSASAFAVSPTSLAFGTVAVGQSKADSVKIKNTGTDTLKISSVIARSDDFTPVPTTANIKAGDSIYCRISFLRLDPGTKSSYIVFSHNAPSAKDSISVSGTADPLATPTLTSPANTAVNQPLALSLQWGAVPGATLYRVQVSTNANFSPTTVDDSTLTATTKALSALTLNTTYYWRVLAKNSGATGTFSSAFNFKTIVTSSVEQLGSGIPTAFALEQNYPNPFNPSTSIEFALPKEEFTSLKVFDLLGREVATLANEVLAAGRYTIAWRPQDISSGMYLFRLQAGSYIESKRMLLLR